MTAKRQGGQGHHVVVSLRVALIGHSTLKGSWGDGLSRTSGMGFVGKSEHRKHQEIMIFSYEHVGVSYGFL